MASLAAAFNPASLNAFRNVNNNPADATGRKPTEQSGDHPHFNAQLLSTLGNLLPQVNIPSDGALPKNAALSDLAAKVQSK